MALASVADGCKKGATIFRETELRVFLLKNLVTGVRTSLIKLPRIDQVPSYNLLEAIDGPESALLTGRRKSDSEFLRFWKKLVSLRTFESYCTIIALNMAVGPFDLERNEELQTETFEAPDCLQEGWTYVQEEIDWDRACKFYHQVRNDIIFASIEHPLQHYAANLLFGLEEDEMERVASLSIEDKWIPGCSSKTSRSNRLVVSHHLQAYAAQQPDIIAAVLPRRKWAVKISHSHIPNAEVSIQTKECPQNDGSERSHFFLQLDALYNLDKIHDVSINMPVEPPGDCQCLKCRYEGLKDSPDLSRLDYSVTAMKMLAGSYLANHELDVAKKLLWQLYNGDGLSKSEYADTWHAIGATYLTQNLFLKAQRHWKKGDEDRAHGECCTELRDQLVKQDAYRYFHAYHTKDQISKPQEYNSLGSSVFSTPNLVGIVTCQDIIRWAEDCEWTTGRHYAVPTTDIPVHKVPRLLAWFNEWMEDVVQPLLASQFREPSRRFFVHDAFVVRYAASESSSRFLPLHRDESTHSLVLSLNGGSFQGGGTYFLDLDRVVSGRAGDLISFRGDRCLHGGAVVTRGVRYILTAFLYADDESCVDNEEGGDSAPLSSKRRKITGEDGEDGEDVSQFQFGFF